MHRVLVPLALLLALLGCQQRVVRVEMSAGDQGLERSIATNALDEAGRERLASAYGAAPRPDAATGGVRVAGVFEEELPREVGNRGGVASVPTEFGTAWFYFEAFPAEADDASGLEGDDWRSLRMRMAAGELWVRLFGRWARQRVPEPRRAEFDSWVDGTLVPMCNDIMLRYASMQATAQSARPGARIRGAEESGTRSEDEAFFARVFTPLLLALGVEGADASLAALLTPEEIHRLHLLALDGNAGGGSREWSSSRIFMPVIMRQVRRFRPDAREPSRTELLAMGFSFLIWATTSADRDDLLLACEAIPESDKERVRRGDRAIPLPAPYGIDPRGRGRPTEAEVTLRTAAPPYATNGEWLAASGEVRFAARLWGAQSRTVLYQPIFFAAWAVPDVDAQRRHLGTLALEDEALAEYALWREMLSEAERTAWRDALVALQAGDAARAVALLDATRQRREAPAALREALVRRARTAM